MQPASTRHPLPDPHHLPRRAPWDCRSGTPGPQPLRPARPRSRAHSAARIRLVSAHAPCCFVYAALAPNLPTICRPRIPGPSRVLAPRRRHLAAVTPRSVQRARTPRMLPDARPCRAARRVSCSRLRRRGPCLACWPGLARLCSRRATQGLRRGYAIISSLLYHGVRSNTRERSAATDAQHGDSCSSECRHSRAACRPPARVERGPRRHMLMARPDTNVSILCCNHPIEQARQKGRGPFNGFFYRRMFFADGAGTGATLAESSFRITPRSGEQQAPRGNPCAALHSGARAATLRRCAPL